MATSSEIIERVARKWADQCGMIEGEVTRIDTKFFVRAICEELGVTAEMVKVLEAIGVSCSPHKSHANEVVRNASDALSLLLEIADG